MGFKCGIIGLPNVGKSTLFNALTKANVKAENFLFCTIKPNISIIQIPDLRLKKLSEIVNSQRILPATIKFIDIAGLIKGAYKGDGLGNQFLTNIRETEIICHVVRCFENDNIIHIMGKVNPSEDIEIINTELILSDLDICERALYRVIKKSKIGDKGVKDELEVLEKCLIQLRNYNALRMLNLDKREKKLICYLNFLTLKPIIYIANVNEDGFKKNEYLDQVYTIAKKENSIVVPVCAVTEVGITESNNEKCNKFTQKLGVEKSGLSSITHTCYILLNLQTYFTVSTKEVRAWIIPMGTTALQAASKIHTDFKKGFIRAQIVSYEDFITYKGERGSKEAGKIHLEGKDYIVKDGDVINFLFNV